MSGIIKSLVLMGADLSPIASSAKRAGFKVFSVDFFGDPGLSDLCEESLSIIDQRRGVSCGVFERDYSARILLELFKRLLENNSVDGVVLGSGLEDYPRVLEEIHRRTPIMGNDPARIRSVRDKEEFFQVLGELEIPHPQTAIVHGLGEAEEVAEEIGYPLILKPLKGFGGLGVSRIGGAGELGEAFHKARGLGKGALIQEFISGTPVSVSLLSTSLSATSVSVNEQLLGVKGLGTRGGFVYCGNIVPLQSNGGGVESCKRISERVVSHYGLVGCNGVDLVISEEGVPFVIEVNPRFQGSAECVERVYGLNLAEAHIKACVEGRLPAEEECSPSSCCTRLILYSPKASRIPNLRSLDGLRDLPLQGSMVEEGEPLCSLIYEGATRTASLNGGLRLAEDVFNSLLPPQQTRKNGE